MNYQYYVDEAINILGKQIVIATPLAMGKPNCLLNAFYERAKQDPSVHLTIGTALTLEKPTGKSFLENRFVLPMVERVFGDYPDLHYEKDRRNNSVPSNIRIVEFYFPPGKFVNNPTAQMDYISSNYTHVARDMADLGVNLILQMVAKKNINGQDYLSLSCNADVTLDLINLLNLNKKKHLCMAQVNQNLPFMYGDAIVPPTTFDYVIDNKDDYYHLFAPPKMSISDPDFMIGFHASGLIKDDGELQVGIGSLGDSLIYCLLLRHQQNQRYKDIHAKLLSEEKYKKNINKIADWGPFQIGLFGATEMLVDGYQHLYQAGILKKSVYDNFKLQKLLNSGHIKEEFHQNIIAVLQDHNVISNPVDQKSFDFLIHWGILREEVQFVDGIVILEDGRKCSSDLIPALGKRLRRGHIVHGGFFLGPQTFYNWLKGLSEKERARFAMKSVQKINQLYGHEKLDRLHRKNARFVNSCMMTTLSGSHVSDGLENAQVVSGVGGQYNFVAMAQELPDGHSILMMRSTRTDSRGKVKSNIVDHYGHITIPRHLRDILVTEYGVAYLRGKTDREIIIELIKVCDSRFQQSLVDKAISLGKLEEGFSIPFLFTKNLPSSFEKILADQKQDGFFAPFPFGTDFTAEELVIGKALKSLKKDLSRGPKGILKILWDLLIPRISTAKKNEALLQRMDLENPSRLKEKIYKKLLLSRL